MRKGKFCKLEISFKKALKTSKAILFEENNLKFEGHFYLVEKNLVKIEGILEGDVIVECKRCAEEMSVKIKERICILASKGLYKGNEIDVIEFFEDSFNVKKILNSEIESIKCDYYVCDKCKENEIFEREF